MLVDVYTSGTCPTGAANFVNERNGRFKLACQDSVKLEGVVTFKFDKIIEGSG